MSAAKLVMKLTGKRSGWIKGDSKIDSHRDQIELQDWGWGLDAASDRNASQKTATPGPLTFAKFADRATAKMLTAMRRGEFLEAELTIKDSSDEYIEITARLDHALLVSYDLRLDPGDKSGEITERWTFDYAHITFEHRATVREGFASVELHRPAGASNDDPDAGARVVKRELADLFSRVGEAKLKAQFDDWLDEIRKERSAEAGAAPAKTPAGRAKTPGDG